MKPCSVVASCLFTLWITFFSPLSSVGQSDLDLYLLIGQSNMAGRAPIPEGMHAPLAGVFLLDSLGNWLPAAQPLNLHSSVRKRVGMQRMGPGYGFAQTLRRHLPERQVGLVVNARGGSSLKQWMPGQTYFEEAVGRAKQAQASGTFKAVLWHQGEADVSWKEDYADSLAVMQHALREAIGKPDLPFIAGELAPGKPEREAFNAMLTRLPARLHRTEVVKAEDLFIFDQVHFDATSQRILGERYAEKVLRLVYNRWRLPGQARFLKPSFTRVYQRHDTTELKLTFYYPPDFDARRKYPAMVFFFGGGWVGGSIRQFQPHAQYFAARGMVCVLADYRVRSRHQTSPQEAVMDAKAAIRYLRIHHQELGINPEKIVGAGGSAGGHLAAAAGMVPGLEPPGQDPAISARPDALVLFNPVYDNGPDGYGFERVGGEPAYKYISPLHNIRPGAPPAIVFFGDQDPLVSVATAKAFQAAMRDVGSRSDLFVYEGQGHGFFNLSKGESMFRATVYQADLFLEGLGYLQGKPGIYP